MKRRQILKALVLAPVIIDEVISAPREQVPSASDLAFIEEEMRRLKFGWLRPDGIFESGQEYFYRHWCMVPDGKGGYKSPEWREVDTLILNNLSSVV